MSRPERRRATRTSLVRPAKVQCQTTGRYYAAELDNVSDTGAMVAIDSPSLLVAGQRLKVGVAWDEASPLIRQDDMLGATVVRAVASGGRQYVGLCYDQAQALRQAG